MPKIDYAAELNAEQLAAVTAPDGPLLVLAAAGTGKTRTLVYRVAYLVERGVDPRHILLLTFTNRAAREMMERAAVVAGPGVGGVWGGTFHHMANRVLRPYAERLGYGSDYAIIDRDDSKSLVASCMKALKLEKAELPKPAILLEFFSAAANTARPLGEILSERLNDERFHGAALRAQDIEHVAGAYMARKRQLNAMDFDDMLINILRLFREHADVQARYQSQFAHVLVDEYQDTNIIQAELVDRVAAGRRNLLVVGDDFQSIYSWRGANIANILTFANRYPDARVYKLETNYRSVPEILAVANACIAHNPQQYQKTLHAVRESSQKPSLIRVRDGDEQARYVVELVKKLVRDGYPLSEIAVLYRAHFHAMELERELAHTQMPYVITSGVRFFEQAHIKDVCAALRLALSVADELSFLRLMGLLDGVGARTAEKVWEKLGHRFVMADAAARDLLTKLLPSRAQSGWQAMCRAFAAYAGGASIAEGKALLRDFTDQFYADYAAKNYENSDDRLDDVEAMNADLGRFDSLQQFISDVSLLSNLDAELDDKQGVDVPTLKLSTIHQAKGLEWPVVILLWAVEGMFPSSRSTAEGADDSEERRLFYVTVTRAKDELHMCVPEVRRMRDGGMMYCMPSRFVSEIPSGCFKLVSGSMY